MIGDDPACNQVRAYARLRDYATRRAAYPHCVALKSLAIKDDLDPALHRSSILVEDNVHRTAATRPMAGSCQVEIIQCCLDRDMRITSPSIAVQRTSRSSLCSAGTR
jgi:hypothetical protein